MQVRDHRPEPAKGVRMTTVPKYPTLLAVLGLDDGASDPDDHGPDPEVDDLVAAMLTSAGGWEGFGGS